LTATVLRNKKDKTHTIHQPTVPSAMNVRMQKANNYAGLQHQQSMLTKRRMGQYGKHIWYNAGYGSRQNTYFPLVKLNNIQHFPPLDFLWYTNDSQNSTLPSHWT